MTPNLESAPSVAAQLSLPLCLALALSPFPVPHGPSVSYQDHAPLGASEPGGGFGSLHDHRICPPALGWALPKEVTWAAAPTALGPIPKTGCSNLSSPAATSIPEDA